MGGIREILAGIDARSQSGLDKLYETFRSIPDYELPIVRRTLAPGESLIRQRVNPKGVTFTQVSQLSYPPASRTSYGRVNIPGNPMFYACTFPSRVSDKAPIPRVVALEETSAFMRDKSSSGIERATVSRWDVVASIDLIALPFIGPYTRSCPDLLVTRDGWKDAISKGIVPKMALDLVVFMAEEIAKAAENELEYAKIAHFVYYLLRINLKTKDADGIIYPSVPAQGAGFNVALKPESVDAKIRFSNASECHLLKNKDKSFVIPMKDAKLDEYGNISFRDRVLSPQEWESYDEYSEGLTFVN